MGDVSVVDRIKKISLCQISNTMAAGNIRKKLITYLADADEKKVKAIYTLFEEEINKEEAFKLSEEHLKILEERRALYKSGKDTGSSWQAAHDRIRKKRK